MKEIQLTRGFVALVDDEDFDRISKFKWYAQKDGYAARNSNLSDGTKWTERFTVLMHRAIMNCPDDLQVDHRNRKRVDNQKSNLRFCSEGQQARNREIPNSYSGLKGAIYNKRNKNYNSWIVTNKQRRWLGTFKTAEEAHAAYKSAAIELHGEFATF